MKLKRVVMAVGSGVALATIGTIPAQAVLLVTPSDNATTLVNNIVGSGITTSNLSYTGAAGASGTFTGGTSAGIGIDAGIIITTGNATLAPGPNNAIDAGADNGLAGDSSLDAIAAGVTQDASVLSFDFTTDTNDVFLKFIFASEEYPEYVNQGFSDVFGFFVDGQNIALVPGKTTAVSIDTINNGLDNTGINAQNPGLYNANPAGATGLQYDGFTTAITAQALGLTPGNHTIKLAIADVGDGLYDSAVFLQLNSFSGTNPDATAVPEPFTIIGTLIGGTAAVRMRKKLKATTKI